VGGPLQVRPRTSTPSRRPCAAGDAAFRPVSFGVPLRIGTLAGRTGTVTSSRGRASPLEQPSEPIFIDGRFTGPQSGSAATRLSPIRCASAVRSPNVGLVHRAGILRSRGLRGHAVVFRIPGADARCPQSELRCGSTRFDETRSRLSASTCCPSDPAITLATSRMMTSGFAKRRTS
jgi:hypothetical protein